MGQGSSRPPNDDKHDDKKRKRPAAPPIEIAKANAEGFSCNKKAKTCHHHQKALVPVVEEEEEELEWADMSLGVDEYGLPLEYSEGYVPPKPKPFHKKPRMKKALQQVSRSIKKTIIEEDEEEEHEHVEDDKQLDEKNGKKTQFNEHDRQGTSTDCSDYTDTTDGDSPPSSSND